MAFFDAAAVVLSPTILVGITTLLVIIILFHQHARHSVPNNAPRHVRMEEWPILGAVAFFTERWAFIERASQHTKSGNFSFWVGNYPIIALRGEEARKTFMDSKQLDAAEGYRTLLGGQPNDQTGKVIDNDYFSKRISQLLKGPMLRDGLPLLLSDLRSMLDDLVKDERGILEPFDHVYRMVFQLTMRTVACNEIANDRKLSAKVLSCFETIEKTGDTALAIMYPSLWTTNKIRRTWAGIQLYMLFNGVVSERKKSGKRDNDALQFLIDQGDDVRKMIEFVMGALFAGQINSGINAAWMVLYLSRYPYWHNRVREEVVSVADRYCADTDLPLKERLMRVPIEAWETEFPTIDLCLKETIRLSMNGTAFRRNTSGGDLQIGKSGSEVIPDKAYVVYPVQDTHRNPSIYNNPNEWEPGRYLPDRAEDKKAPYAWWGWGVSRHPCLGMRFAKLENNLITAFWLAYFDSEVCDANGNSVDKLAKIDVNAHSAKKPVDRSFVRYSVRND